MFFTANAPPMFPLVISYRIREAATEKGDDKTLNKSVRRDCFRETPRGDVRNRVNLEIKVPRCELVLSNQKVNGGERGVKEMLFARGRPRADRYSKFRSRSISR